MKAPFSQHFINDTPLSCPGTVLQDLIFFTATPSSYNVKLIRQFSDNNQQFLVTCHYHSLVDVCPTEKTARTRKISRRSPGGRILYEELSGGVSGHNHSASHEECLKYDDTINLFISIYYEYLPCYPHHCQSSCSHAPICPAVAGEGPSDTHLQSIQTLGWGSLDLPSEELSDQD